MDNKQVTAEWIAQQRAVCGNVKRLNLFSLAEADKIFKVDMPAALDALEAAYAEIARLTAERDAEKRRADAGAIRTAVRPFEKGDKNTLTKYTQFCKRLAASHRPDMPSEDRMLLLLTDLCIDRLCVSMQRVTAERDAAIKDAALSKCKTCASRENCYVDADCDICIDWQWRGLCASNTDAPTGAERHNPIQDVSMGGMNIHNYGDVTNQQFISIDTVDKDLNL